MLFGLLKRIPSEIMTIPLMARFSDIKEGLKKLKEGEALRQEGHNLIFAYFCDKVDEYGPTEFASRCGKTKQYISNVKAGRAPVASETLIEMLETVTKENYTEKKSET